MTKRRFSASDHERSGTNLRAAWELLRDELRQWEENYPKGHPVIRSLRVAVNRTNKARVLAGNVQVTEDGTGS